ncbi:hypothetical protein V8F33_001968 [Rhypophila sp. PSN 637]
MHLNDTKFRRHNKNKTLTKTITLLTTATLFLTTTTAAPTTSTSPNLRANTQSRLLNITPHTLKKRTCSGLQYPQLRTPNKPDQPIPYSVSISTTQSAQVEVGFSIPSDAVGPCSLMLSLPAGCSITGGAQINVYALDGPAAGDLVGTTIFTEGTKATINSFSCREQMCYGLEVASAADGTAVEFVEGAGVGLSMTYDC